MLHVSGVCTLVCLLKYREWLKGLSLQPGTVLEIVLSTAKKSTVLHDVPSIDKEAQPFLHIWGQLKSKDVKHNVA